jgi:glutamate synthase domain-containing protein 1
MATDSAAITLYGIGIIVAIIGYFLRAAHMELKKVMESQAKVLEDQGKLKGKIELVEQESRLKYQAIQEQTQLEIKSLARNVSELSDAVKQLILNR